MNQTNPFLQAKRQKTPRAHVAMRATKYPHLWKLSIDDLKSLYRQTEDKYLRGAITRCLNEKLGIKIIRSTEKQLIARKLNYISFVTAGYKKQLAVGVGELVGHKDSNEDLGDLLFSLRQIQSSLESLMHTVSEVNRAEAGPRKRIRSTASWNKEGAKK